MKEEDMEVIAETIAMMLKDPEGSAGQARANVKALTDKYPLM